MIDGIEQFYQRIAESVQENIPEPWFTAWIDAIFFSDHAFYSGEYMTDEGCSPKSFATGREARRAFVDLRDLFKQARQPVWCKARFMIQSNGQFNMKWHYDDCDENGFARFDEETELKRMRALRG